MTPFAWQQRVQLAETDTEVVEVANQFLATLQPRELALLPPRCRPRTLLCAADVSSYAFELVGQRYVELDATARLVHEMAAFFTQASVRLADIVTRTNAGQAGIRRSA